MAACSRSSLHGFLQLFLHLSICGGWEVHLAAMTSGGRVPCLHMADLACRSAPLDVSDADELP